MISAKKIKLLAVKKWDTGRKWSDTNREILRHIYGISSRRDRKINIQFFCDCAGISLAEAWKIGQLSQFRDDLKRRKYGQKIRTKKSNFPGTREIFKEESEITDHIREQYAWRSVRDQRGTFPPEGIPILLAIIFSIAFLILQVM